MLYTLFKKDRDDYQREDRLRLDFSNIYIIWYFYDYRENLRHLL